MSEFRGLHNHERHMAFAVDGDGDTAWCQANCEHGAGTQCAVGDPCRCCLTAEVDALRVQVSEERDLRLAAQTRADAAEDQMEDDDE